MKENTCGCYFVIPPRHLKVNLFFLAASLWSLYKVKRRKKEKGVWHSKHDKRSTKKLFKYAGWLEN